jgi:hypothetical protein
VYVDEQIHKLVYLDATTRADSQASLLKSKRLLKMCTGQRKM